MSTLTPLISQALLLCERKQDDYLPVKDTVWDGGYYHQLWIDRYELIQRLQATSPVLAEDYIIRIILPDHPELQELHHG